MPPHEASFPSTDFDFSFAFECLSTSQIVELLGYLIRERKALFLSKHVKVLTNVIQTFLTLLWPFKWVRCHSSLILISVGSRSVSFPSKELERLPRMPNTLHYRLPMGLRQHPRPARRRWRRRSFLRYKGDRKSYAVILVSRRREKAIKSGYTEGLALGIPA